MASLYCLCQGIVLLQLSLNVGSGSDQKSDSLEQRRQAIRAEASARLEHSFAYLRSERHLYDLLHLREIRKELRLELSAFKQFQSIVTETERKVLESHSNGEHKSPQLRFIQYQLEQDIRADALRAIRALMSENQRKRLHQVALHCEIDALGLSIALTEGKFGRMVGVTDNQKSHLSDVAARMEDRERLARKASHEILHRKILGLLNPEERAVADSLLGGYFDTFNDNWMHIRSRRDDLADEVALDSSRLKDLDGEIVKEAKSRGMSVAPSATDFHTKYTLLFKRRVQEELGLTPEQVGAIIEGGQITSEYSKQERERFQQKARERVDEILSPHQQSRLAQLANYLEIGSRGYAKFFTRGNFSRLVAMDRDRQAFLMAQIDALEREDSENCIKIRHEAIDLVLNELSSSQKAAAKEALGDFFYCPEYLFFDKRAEKTGYSQTSK